MFKYNYHAHSVYCNHASESLEGVVKLAIKHGFKEFGISEHGPIQNLRGQYRLNESDLPAYFHEMNMLKIKYTHQIKLYTGFEADLVNYVTGVENTNWIIKHLASPDLDYLLLANHTYGAAGHVFVTIPNLKMAQEWLDIVKRAWKTGKFLYMVHPDAFANAYLEANQEWDEVAHFLAQELTSFAAKHNMPLGFNLNGLKDQKGYPALKFWKIAAQNKAQAILELDTHDPDTFKSKHYQKAMTLIKKSGVQLLNKLDIIKPNK